jgi:hypothetical protein
MRASIVEVETTTLTAPQFDSRMTDITKPSLFSERDDGGAACVAEVTALPVSVSPKALCWKSVTAWRENLCYGDVD